MNKMNTIIFLRNRTLLRLKFWQLQGSYLFDAIKNWTWSICLRKSQKLKIFSRVKISKYHNQRKSSTFQIKFPSKSTAFPWIFSSFHHFALIFGGDDLRHIQGWFLTWNWQKILLQKILTRIFVNLKIENFTVYLGCGQGLCWFFKSTDHIRKMFHRSWSCSDQKFRYSLCWRSLEIKFLSQKQPLFRKCLIYSVKFERLWIV